MNSKLMKMVMVAVVGFAIAQPASALPGWPHGPVTLGNMGGFNNVYTYSHTYYFPYPIADMEDGALTYTFLAGPDNIGGKQFQMVLCMPPGGTELFLFRVLDRNAPWDENGRIDFNSDGTVRSSYGYGETLDFSRHYVAWADGGFGPGYPPEPDPVVLVDVDIMPGSCANPFNVATKGVLPVVILGDGVVDLQAINLSTIRLGRCDMPAVSVAPKMARFADVGGGEAHCDAKPKPDSIIDVNLHFDRAQITAALGPVLNEELVDLCLSATLNDGSTVVIGGDTVRILKKGKAK